MTLTSTITTWLRCSLVLAICPDLDRVRALRDICAYSLRLHATNATLRLRWLLLGRPNP